MKYNFWQELKRPFFCLAPMSDVTDIAFRTILAKYGKNSQNRDQVVFWTEFVAADGLCHKLARKKLSHILKFSEKERPIIAKVFGANPEIMKKACQYIAGLGFDGIDTSAALVNEGDNNMYSGDGGDGGNGGDDYGHNASLHDGLSEHFENNKRRK